MAEANIVPNFFVVGVVKGGTTSLYHYLEQHPDIYLPPIKETNHFAQADIQPEHFLKEYKYDVAIDLDKYIREGMARQIHIAHVDDPDHYKALFSRRNGARAVGEISNSYMICPSSAKAIYNFNPSAKIIVVLRNPVTRAWSQYLMNRRESKTSTTDFITELEQDQAKLHKGWGVSHQYLELGLYATQLERYIKLFGKENVLPIFFEEYTKTPQTELERICTFLGISSKFIFNVDTQKNTASLPRFVGVNKVLVQSGALKFAKDLVPRALRGRLAAALYTDKGLPKISESERNYLRSYYSSEVHALKSLIGRDVAEVWKEFSSTPAK